MSTHPSAVSNFRSRFKALFAFFTFTSFVFCLSSSQTLTYASDKKNTLNKYLDEILIQSKKLKPPTVGVELEGGFPGSTRSAAYQKINSLMLEKIAPILYPQSKITVENFDFKTRSGDPRKGSNFLFEKSDGEKALWQVKDDGSIIPPENYIGIEIVSPILKNKNDIEKLYLLINEFKNAGFIELPNSAALQVHVGFIENGPLDKTLITPNTIIAETLLLIWIFSKIENELMKTYETSLSRQKFALPTPQSIIDAIEANGIPLQDIRLFEALRVHYWYRYWALNLDALFQFGTIELRFANSTTNRKKIEALIDFGQKLVLAIKTKNPNLINLFSEYLSKRNIPLKELSKALDLKLMKTDCLKLLLR